MVESAGEIQARIGADQTGARRGVKAAQRTFKDFVRGLKRLSGTIGITISVAFAARKFTNFIKLSIQITKEFELQRAALTAIVQGQERFLDLAGQQIPVEKARTQALKVQEQLFKRITEEGLRPILSTSKEFQGIMTALLPTFRQFGVSLEDSVSLMVKMADAATLTSIPLDEMVNQSRQILSSNISNETKLAKIVGLNNEIVNQAKIQGKLGQVLSQRFGVIADNVDLVRNTLAAASVELRNQVELRIDEHFEGARDAITEMLQELTKLVGSDAFGKLLGFANGIVVAFAETTSILSETIRKTDNLRSGMEDLSKMELEALAFTETADVVRARQNLVKGIEENVGVLADLKSEMASVGEAVSISDVVLSKFRRGLKTLGVDVIDPTSKMDELRDRFISIAKEVNKAVEELKRIEPALKRVADLPGLGEEGVLIQQLAVAGLTGDVVELKKVEEALKDVAVTSDEVRIAETLRLDPSVIDNALTNIGRITSALSGQAKLQSTIRSLELQRVGVNKQIADNIAQAEVEAEAFNLRQIQLRQAQSVLEQQTRNLVSDTGRLAEELDSVFIAATALRVELKLEEAVLQEQLLSTELLAGLTDEQKDAKKKVIEQQIKGLRIDEKVHALKVKLVAIAKEEFEQATGVLKRETEIGRLRETQAPNVARLLTIIEQIKAADKVRVLSLQAQNVEIQEQIRGLQQTNREARLANQQFLETELLMIKQRFESERSQAVGIDRQILEINQEIERVESRIGQLREKRNVEASREGEILLKLAALDEQRTAQVEQRGDAEQRVLDTQSELVTSEKELQAAREIGVEDATVIAEQKQVEAKASAEAAQQAGKEVNALQEQTGLAQQRLTLEQEGLRNEEQRITNEIEINQELLKQLEIQKEIQRAQELGRDVGQRFRGTVEGAIQQALDGDFEFRKLGKQFAADMLQAGLKPFLDQFQQSMAILFQKLAGQFAGMLGAAVISIVGLLGTLAFTKASASGTPTGAGLGKAFEERGEPFRGVVAGRKSIPVAQIRNALSSALINTNSILRQIASNTARSAENITVAGSDESDEILAATAAG